MVGRAAFLCLKIRWRVLLEASFTMTGQDVPFLEGMAKAWSIGKGWGGAGGGDVTGFFGNVEDGKDDLVQDYAGDGGRGGVAVDGEAMDAYG